MLCPVLVVACELWLNDGRLRLEPWGLPLLAWGYAQYRLAGRYRLRLGGGGPGMDTPPERLVTTGPFALSLRSWPGTAIALGTAAWLQFRVLRDERRLVERFGEAYMQYCLRVKRWIPALF